MAKVTFGGVVTDARNKLGDVVYSRNRGGSYARAVTALGVRHTSTQAAQRAAFKAAVQRWYTTLTNDQRAQWRAYADRCAPVPKPIGAHRHTGQQLYVKFNGSFNYLLNTFADAPPQHDSLPLIENPTVAVDIDAATFNISATMTAPTGNQWLQFYLSRPVSPSITNIQRRILAVDGIFAGDPNPKNIWAAYTAYLGTPTPGQKIFYAAQWYDADNVIIGPRLTGSTIVLGTGDPMLKRTVTLTPTDVQNLVASPFELIPTPGPAKTILVLAAFWNMHFNTTPYTNPSATLPTVCLGTPPGTTEQFNFSSGTLTYGADIIDTQTGGWVGNDDTANAADKPLVLFNPGPLEYAAGDSDIHITTYYVIQDL